jgi:hypothetical protein
MIYLLITHIAIGTLLVLSVIARFLAVIFRKTDVSTGRYYIVALGSALILSGVALVIVAHAPLTGACLTSLAIVIGVLGYELGLQYIFDKRTAKEKVLSDKNDY